MKKLTFLVFIMSLIVLNGCGGGNGGGPGTNGPGNPTPTLTINIFDKSTGGSLPGATLNILETNQNNIDLNNNSSYQNTFNSGVYTLYVSKNDYTAKGYQFNLTSDLTLNVYLSPLSTTNKYENISGNVKLDNNNYTNPFNIYRGSNAFADCEKNDITDPQGSYSLLSACSSNIVVSAYSKKTGNPKEIDKIGYLKTSLSQGTPITNLTLQLPITPITYAGTKPGWSIGVDSEILRIKQQEGYILAEQKDTGPNFSFGVGIVNGDNIILESNKTIHYSTYDLTYFSRINVGSSGGTNIIIQYPSEVADYYIVENADNYQFNITTPASFANYYEVYATEETNGVLTIPFKTAVLSGSSIKVPKSLFNPNAQTTLVYVRSVRLDGFNANLIFNGNYTNQNYSYTEKETSIVLSTSSNSLNANRYLDAAKVKAMRDKYKLTQLCFE